MLTPTLPFHQWHCSPTRFTVNITVQSLICMCVCEYSRPDYSASEALTTVPQSCINKEILRRGGLILFCDYVVCVITNNNNLMLHVVVHAKLTVIIQHDLHRCCCYWLQCENLNDAEHMTWVIINHVNDLIDLSQEPPVQDFIR